MTLRQHAVCVGVLAIGAAVLFSWLTHNAEVTFADGLRYIHQAERIDQGDWTHGLLRSIDHPLHPLAMVAARRLLGGRGPVSWQHAAQAASIAAVVLLVVPVYLLALELYGPTTAWFACLLVVIQPMTCYVVVNILSETTFLLFWTWGLWCSVRFLRNGRVAWLPPTLATGAFAYLARPEGLLLPLALLITLVGSSLHWTTRLAPSRWWSAVAILVAGPLLLVGPFMAAKGGVGTKPSVARLIGTAPPSPPLALERDKPLPPGQTTAKTYRLASVRALRVIGAAVNVGLLPWSILGVVLARPWVLPRTRAWLFQAVLITAAAAALVRLHATGGYCTLRHAFVPSMLLRMAAAHGWVSVARALVIQGRWFGLPGVSFRPVPAVWAVLLALCLVLGQSRPSASSPAGFAVYQDVGDWIARRASRDGRVLDMTDWSLYFSGRPGYIFADVYQAAADPATRWVVVQDAHLRGRWHYSAVLNELLAGRRPVATYPERGEPGRLRIRVYDRRAVPAVTASAPTASRLR
jgi:hypothetical protein